MRTSRLGAALIVSLMVGASAPGSATEPRSDTIVSLAESSGCGAFNGIRGPQMGPGPYDPTYPYSALPGSAELHGPWADLFGRTIDQVHSDLVVVHLPGQPKDLYIHERVLPAFNQVLDNLAVEAGKGNVYEIRSDTWSYNPATVPPGRHLSFHGVGASIDVNSTTNPYSAANVLTTDMPEWFIDAWRDAGWCWGGDWISIKDPMHFAWMGPILTLGYGPDPAPYPATTAASTFDTPVAVPNRFATTRPGSTHLAIDIDRDGAPDVVRFQVSSTTGGFRLEVAQTWRRFETCTATQWSASPAAEIDHVVMGDFTSDGRPEVWLLDESGSEVTAAIYRVVSQVSGDTTITGQPQLVTTIATGIPSVAGAQYLVGDHDRDTKADLYVVTPGTTTHLDVWQGPSFTTRLVDVDLAIATDLEWRFALGDHDLDGVPDLYALSPDSPATLRVVRGASGFTGTPTTTATGVARTPDETLSVEDYDGDGRDDLYLLGIDGRLRVILGGVRSAGADLDGWFVKEDLTWTPGTGCEQPGLLRVVTVPAVPSQIRVDGVPADSWGLNWVKMAPGQYTVSFRDVGGYTTPAPQTVTVTSNATTTVTATFTQRGTLRVTTNPPVRATISIDGIPRNNWGVWTDLDPADYHVCFGPVADMAAPACETVTVTAGTLTELAGIYTPSPGAPGPSGVGLLRVTTNPAVPSQILIDGVPADSWGLNWLRLIPGDYTVSFSDVAGYTTPAPHTVTITDGVTTTISGDFTAHGVLRITTNPPVPANISIDGTPRNKWGLWTDLPAGDYTLCYGTVTGYTPPVCHTTTITPNTTTTITSTYIASP